MNRQRGVETERLKDVKNMSLSELNEYLNKNSKGKSSETKLNVEEYGIDEIEGKEMSRTLDSFNLRDIQKEIREKADKIFEELTKKSDKGNIDKQSSIENKNYDPSLTAPLFVNNAIPLQKPNVGRISKEESILKNNDDDYSPEKGNILTLDELQKYSPQYNQATTKGFTNSTNPNRNYNQEYASKGFRRDFTFKPSSSQEDLSEVSLLKDNLNLDQHYGGKCPQSIKNAMLALQKKLHEVVKDYTELKSAFERLKQDYDNSNNQLQITLENERNLKSFVSDLEAEKKANLNRIHNLNSDLFVVKRNNDILEKEKARHLEQNMLDREGLSSEIHQILKENQELNQKNKELQDEVKEMKNQINTLKEEKKAMEKHILLLKEDLLSAKIDSKSLNHEFSQRDFVINKKFEEEKNDLLNYINELKGIIKKCEIEKSEITNIYERELHHQIERAANNAAEVKNDKSGKGLKKTPSRSKSKPKTNVSGHTTPIKTKIISKAQGKTTNNLSTNTSTNTSKSNAKVIKSTNSKSKSKPKIHKDSERYKENTQQVLNSPQTIYKNDEHFDEKVYECKEHDYSQYNNLRTIRPNSFNSQVQNTNFREDENDQAYQYSQPEFNMSGMNFIKSPSNASFISSSKYFSPKNNDSDYYGVIEKENTPDLVQKSREVLYGNTREHTSDHNKSSNDYTKLEHINESLFSLERNIASLKVSYRKVYESLTTTTDTKESLVLKNKLNDINSNLQDSMNKLSALKNQQYQIIQSSINHKTS